MLYGVAGSCNIADKKNVIKFIRTAAIPELFFVGKNEININAIDSKDIEYIIQKIKKRKKLIFLKRMKQTIIDTIILTTILIKE